MSGHVNQDFIRGDAATQNRLLRRVGIGGVVTVVVVTLLCWWVIPRATAPQGTTINVVVPDVGAGIRIGAHVILRGAQIGEVTSMSPTPQRGVKLGLLLTDVGGAFISDDFGVQFRPENYFGTTAVDLTAGSSGVRVGDNETYVRTSAPDRSMSQMLTTGSIAVDGTLTTQMISSLDKVIKYANGLTPLVQSGIVIADSVAATQRNLPSELLAKANDVMAAFPAFNLGAMSGLYSIFDSVYMKHGADGSLTPDEDYFTYMEDGLKVAGTNLFGQAGALLKSHSTELPALTQVLTYLLEQVPSMVGGPQTMDQILTAIDQSKSAFTGPPGQQTLRIRLALNSLPSMAGPLAITGRRGGGAPAAPASPNTQGDR